VAAPELDWQEERSPGDDPAAFSRPLAPGSGVSGWQVVGAIREEPDNVLYAVTRGGDGPPACLKLIDPSPLHDSGYFRHLRRAARRWRRVDNPHLVRLVEAGRSPSGPYLATALFVGASLADELEGDGLPVVDASRIGIELASALDAALDAGLSPGALTPQDVTLTSAGALVTDPGVGRGPVREPTDVFGAVDYLSPEEARGERPVPQSAVYSLACLMHRCLTGAPPYPRDLAEAVLYAHVVEPPPRPSERNSSLPAEVDAVFERAMAATPQQRQPGPGRFAHELAAALGGSRVAGAAARAERPQRRREPRPALRRAGALAAVIALCAAGGFALGSSGGTDEAPAPPRAAPPPAPPASAMAAVEIADKLEVRRARLRERLAGARTRTGQARVARRLSGLYASVARGAEEATPGVRRALADARRAHARLAAAATARRAEQRAWAAARAAARRADAALARELSRSAG